MKQVLMTFCTLLCCSCLTLNGVSKFTSDDVRLGMNKTEFVKKFGQPYNKEMFYTDDHRPMERLFYKEEVYSREWTTIITAFTFYESKLVEQEFIRDRPGHTTSSYNDTKP